MGRGREIGARVVVMADLPVPGTVPVDGLVHRVKHMRPHSLTHTRMPASPQMADLPGPGAVPVGGLVHCVQAGPGPCADAHRHGAGPGRTWLRTGLQTGENQ